LCPTLRALGPAARHDFCQRARLPGCIHGYGAGCWDFQRVQRLPSKPC
jgi:hypothetical protein